MARENIHLDWPENRFTVKSFTSLSYRWEADAIAKTLIWQPLYLKQFKAWDWTKITILDLFSLDIESFEFWDFLKLLKIIINLWSNTEYIGNEISNNDWINELDFYVINSILDEAIKFYKTELCCWIPKMFIEKSYFNKDWTANFSNITQLRWFFEIVSKWKNLPHRQIVCSLLKISYVIWLMRSYKQLDSLDLVLKDIIKNRIMSLFTYKDRNTRNTLKADLSNDFFTKLSDYLFTLSPNFLNIDTTWPTFSLNARAKSWLSMLIKLLSNPSYDEIDAIQDKLWMRAQVKNISEWIYLLYFLYQYLFESKSKVEIKNKNFISENDIEWFDLNTFEQRFVSLLKGSIKQKSKRANVDYVDIKITWKVKHNEEIHDLEFAIVLYNNKNETSLYSHHWVLEIKKIIDTLIRLQWYITESHIKRIIFKHISKYPMLLMQSESNINWVERIFNHLISIEYFVRLDIPESKWNVIYFTTKDRWNSIWYNLYPDWAQIKDKYWKRTKEKKSH